MTKKLITFLLIALFVASSATANTPKSSGSIKIGKVLF